MDQSDISIQGVPAMKPGEILLHQGGKCCGIVGPDGMVYTHNMCLTPKEARFFVVVRAVPINLMGYLRAARRRALAGLGQGDCG